MTGGGEAKQQTDAPALSVGEHLDVAASVELSSRLALAVRNGDFVPDLVLGIKEGGILPARVVADALGVKALNISVRRRASAVKHLGPIRWVGRHFGPYLYRFPLVRRVLVAMNRLPGRSVVPASAGDARPITASTRVLVVDDFSCSGGTFVAAGQWLQEQGADPRLIRTAALIAAPDPKQAPPYYPHYWLANVSWVFFPWSSNSPHYNEYLKWKETRSL